MELLKELYKRERAIMPNLRRLTVAASRNQLSHEGKAEFVSLEAAHARLSQQIMQEEQNLIADRFGNEKLQKWNQLRELSHMPHTTASEHGQKVIALKTELADIAKMLEEIKYALG